MTSLCQRVALCCRERVGEVLYDVGHPVRLAAVHKANAAAVVRCLLMLLQETPMRERVTDVPCITVSSSSFVNMLGSAQERAQSAATMSGARNNIALLKCMPKLLPQQWKVLKIKNSCPKAVSLFSNIKRQSHHQYELYKIEACCALRAYGKNISSSRHPVMRY